MINKKEMGIYIHIPFCVQKCNYCDFLSKAAPDKTKEQYVYALIKEIEASGCKYRDRMVSSAFIGGGTPSVLSSELLDLLLDSLVKNFSISSNSEFTIECNPGTLVQDKVKVLKQWKVNRISLGLQSADNDELKILGRIHTFEDFLDTYELLRKEGFTNINIDLMSALPGQSLKSWTETLNKIVSLDPEHISAYSLIVEEGTNLYDRVKGEEAKGIYSLPSEETDRAMYYKTREILETAGYLQYEISNYAKPGFESIHNSSYWTRKNYLGLGLGAASLMDNVRYSNTRDLEYYINHSSYLLDIQADVQVLNTKEQMEEFMFLGLRLIEGVSIKEFKNLFNKDFNDVYGKVTDEFCEKGLIKVNGDRISLTKKGLDLSNYVMAQFLS